MQPDTDNAGAARRPLTINTLFEEHRREHPAAYAAKSRGSKPLPSTGVPQSFAGSRRALEMDELALTLAAKQNDEC